MRWVGLVACMGQMKNANTIVIINQKERDH
jgi:hypothetical protein